MTTPVLFDALTGPSYTPFSLKAESQKSINVFRERIPTDQGVNAFAMYKSPGLLPAITGLKVGPVRGMLSRDTSAKYHAFVGVDDTIYDVGDDLAVDATYGPIVTDDQPIYMAASPNTLMIASAGHLYRINAGALAEITPGPGLNVLNVKFLKNYFIVLYSDLQQFGWSSDDGATFPGGNVQTFEADSNAVKTMEVINQQLVLVGTRITQSYYVGANPNAPFVPNDAAVIRSGTRAPASLKSLGDALFWLESSQDGQGRVIMMQGYNAMVVSNPAISNTFREYARTSTTDDAIGMSYQMNEQEFYRITFPTADKTWEYNKTIGDWVEIAHWDWQLGEYHRHRGMSIMAAFSKILVGDHTNGIVYDMDMSIYHDYGFPLRWERRTPHILDDNRPVYYDRLDLGIQAGVGLTTPLWLNSYSLGAATFATDLAAAVIAGDVSADQAIVLQDIYDFEPYIPLDPYPADDVMEALGFYKWGDDPRIELQYSNDGGNTFSESLIRSIGRVGEYRKQVYWDRLSSAEDRVFQLSGDFPVKYAITTAWLTAEGTLGTRR